MQITSIIGNYPYSKPLAEVADIIKKRFKGEVSMTSHFCVRHQAFTAKQLKEIEEDIGTSDVVFLAMVFDEAVLEIVRKNQGEGKTYLILASVGEGMRMARLMQVDTIIRYLTVRKDARDLVRRKKRSRTEAPAEGAAAPAAEAREEK